MLLPAFARRQHTQGYALTRNVYFPVLPSKARPSELLLSNVQRLYEVSTHLEVVGGGIVLGREGWSYHRGQKVDHGLERAERMGQRESGGSLPLLVSSFCMSNLSISDLSPEGYTCLKSGQGSAWKRIRSSIPT